MIRQLLDRGSLVLKPGHTPRLPAPSGRTAGVFRAHQRGFGFTGRPDGPDLHVARHNRLGARDGEAVSARGKLAEVRPSWLARALASEDYGHVSLRR